MCLDRGTAMGVLIVLGWMASLWDLLSLIYIKDLEALGTQYMESSSSMVGFYVLFQKKLSLRRENGP